MRTCLECGQTTEGLYCPKDGMATIVTGVKPPAGDLPVNTVFAGRYRLAGTLGRGGMGAVYDAQHTGTGQRVAIKTLLLDTVHDPAAVKRFFLEAKITAALQHPNTIRVFDFGQSDDGVFFLAMERLQGVTLSDRIAEYAGQGKRMTEQEAATIAVAVLRSLAEAHRVGLVHRDLKPANIFLHDLGGGETVIKVLDFGIAKTGDQQLTQAGTALGTPAYMSPEQVMGQGVDARSDLYSLGVVLYQCVSGRVPFRGESTFTVMMMQINELAPDLTQVAGVSARFAQVVGQSLAKQATDRYESAVVMREALEPLARGEHLHAPGAAGLAPPSAMAQMRAPTPAAPPPPPPSPPPANRDASATKPPAPVRAARVDPPPMRPQQVREMTGAAVKPPEPPRSRSLIPLYLFGFIAVTGSLAAAFWLHGRDGDAKAPIGMATEAVAPPVAGIAAPVVPVPVPVPVPAPAPAPPAVVPPTVVVPPAPVVAEPAAAAAPVDGGAAPATQPTVAPTVAPAVAPALVPPVAPAAVKAESSPTVAVPKVKVKPKVKPPAPPAGGGGRPPPAGTTRPPAAGRPPR